MSLYNSIFFLFIFTFLFSCKNDKKEIQIKKKINPIINNEHIIEDTILKNDSMIVIKNNMSIDTLFYFYSNQENKKFKVEEKNIKLVRELDFSNYEYKKMFITVIRNGVKENGVNFAGSFCFVYWGCGSPCQSSAVVDMKTGIVYNGINSAVGYQFKKDSKILIVNPTDSTNYYPKNRWINYPTEYLWTGKKFIEINKSGN
jgi:hypothetical protein